MARTANRVQVAVSGTPGTGAITLGSPTTGAQSFSAAGITDGEPVEYLVTDGTAWELGVGVYASTGPTLSRAAIRESSAAGAAISATSAAVVSVIAPAESATMPVVRPSSSAYLLPLQFSGGVANRTTTAGQAQAVPFWVASPVTITRLGCYVATAGTTTLRLALYRDTPSGMSEPGLLLADSGDMANTAGGAKEATVGAVTLRPGVLYWLSVQSADSTCVIRGWPNALRVTGANSSGVSSSVSHLVATRTYGAWETDASSLTWTIIDTTTSPGIWVRQ